MRCSLRVLLRACVHDTAQEGVAAAQRQMDEAAATGLTVEEKKEGDSRLRQRQFGGGGRGSLHGDQSDNKDGKYKKGNEYFGGDSTVFEGND
eukprot:COSAG01_NODE_4630_length_4863_cov_3.556255_4_plen_92_part_00